MSYLILSIILINFLSITFGSVVYENKDSKTFSNINSKFWNEISKLNEKCDCAALEKLKTKEDYEKYYFNEICTKCTCSCASSEEISAKIVI